MAARASNWHAEWRKDAADGRYYEGGYVRLNLRAVHALQAIGEWNLQDHVQLRDDRRYWMQLCPNPWLVLGVWDSAAAMEAHVGPQAQWVHDKGMCCDMSWADVIATYASCHFLEAAEIRGLHEGTMTAAQVLGEDGRSRSHSRIQ